MPSGDASFASFEKELNRLVDSFGKRLAELKQPGYAEAQLRDDFLNPFFRALGWDMENRAGLIQTEREVEIESATQIGGRRKRADYLFRTDKRARFVCEAKKPAEELSARYAFQAKRYAWNKGVPIAVLTDFEELKIYVVGGKPYLDEPQVGEWKNWSFQQYPLIARELWELLGRDRIAAGSIDQALDALPKKATGTGKGKAKQQWLIKPDRTRALDTDFLEFLDETRRDLASDIYKHNDHAELLDGNRLTEACQRVIDRILFLRICEDRDIDTGERLQTIVERWRKNTGNDDTGRRAYQQPLDKLQETPPASFGGDGIRAPKDSLWRAIVRHFRALDRRPPTHVPFFNGNLFKPHFTETLLLSDEWLAGFISELSADESPYLFDAIPVEILGSVYERFLGKVVRPHGKGITVEEKPEVRKAGGVYYTPRYIVDYIVEQTAGKLLDEIAGGSAGFSPLQHPAGRSPEETPKPSGDTTVKRPEGRAPLKDFEKHTAALRLLDPACGSGSFLIRAFERVCEHWQKRLTADLRACVGDEVTSLQSKEASQRLLTSSPTVREWQKQHRPLCWVDPGTGDVHLTVDLKRRILTQNIYGVDLDAAAVEVTQLSLYLKMLEHENRTTLARERELFAEAVALLPPLQDNIKCGNSLIASDFSMMSEDLVRVRAFDWPVQFAPIMKAGGFDAVIGNPPYGAYLDASHKDYLNARYSFQTYQLDSYLLFLERSLRELLRTGGLYGMIIPNPWLTNILQTTTRRFVCEHCRIHEIVHFKFPVFPGVTVDTQIVVLEKGDPSDWTARVLVVSPSERIGDALPALPSVALSHKQEKWRKLDGGVLNIFTSEAEEALAAKIAKQSVRLDSFCDINVGIKPYQVGKGVPKQTKQTVETRPFDSGKKDSKRHRAYLRGSDIARYLISPVEPRFLDYGAWLAEPRPAANFDAPAKIVMRQTGDSIVATLDTHQFLCLNNMHVIVPKHSNPPLKYLLGLVNSRALNWYYHTLNPEVGEALAEVKRTNVAQLPMRLVDARIPADKARHDKLVALVDKLLGLMPKLRAATTESDQATLQNAVTATDQQIDQLVYELYGLTEDEIKLVEGGQ